MSPSVVVALHCSGGSPAQWRTLEAALGDGFEVLTPAHYGDGRAWPGERAFTLSDEASSTVEIIDACHDPVHLVGHSYGGAVALQAALERSDRIASLSLYEPCVFRILTDLGASGRAALADLRTVAAQMMAGVADGAYARTAASFVNYWAGNDAWTALRPAARASIIRWVTKAPLEFRAAMEATTAARHYGTLRCPTVVMRGEYAPTSTRLIADALCAGITEAESIVIEGAGHMGPLTHAPTVNAAIARHIAGCERPARTVGSRDMPRPGALLATIGAVGVS